MSVRHSLIKFSLVVLSITLLWFMYLRMFSSPGNASPIEFSPPTPSTKQSVQKVSIEVYYEALCPDSRHFVMKQLYPAWQKVSEIMDVHFKPYGKASHWDEGSKKVFQCQHGPIECEANRYHACATRHLAGYDDTLISYITCMITDNMNPYESARQCSSKFRVDFQAISSCVQGEEGFNLLAHFGDDTNSLRPAVSFIPTIILNGERDNQSDILRKFIDELCNRYQGQKPANCVISD